MEGIGFTFKQRQVGVHAGTRPLFKRLRHKGRAYALAYCYLLDDVAKGHDVIGHRHDIGMAQVDFLLPRRCFMVRELCRNPHRFQR